MGDECEGLWPYISPLVQVTCASSIREHLRGRAFHRTDKPVSLLKQTIGTGTE